MRDGCLNGDSEWQRSTYGFAADMIPATPFTARTPQKTCLDTPKSQNQTPSGSSALANYRLLYRGSLSLPDSYMSLDGLTFSARLESPMKHHLLENPLALALESMRGRQCLRFVGTVKLGDVWLDETGNVEMCVCTSIDFHLLKTSNSGTYILERFYPRSTLRISFVCYHILPHPHLSKQRFPFQVQGLSSVSRLPWEILVSREIMYLVLLFNWHYRWSRNYPRRCLRSNYLSHCLFSQITSCSDNTSSFSKASSNPCTKARWSNSSATSSYIRSNKGRWCKYP